MNRREFLKKILEGIVIGSIPFINSCKNPVKFTQQTDYFPLKVGNSWTYSPQLEQSITDIKITEYGVYFVFSMYNYENRMFKKDSNSNVIEYKNGQVRLWYKFSALEGESWIIQDSDGSDLMNNCVVTLISKNERVSVPAGTFENCVKFNFNCPDVEDAGLISEWFAPGIGCIKRITQSFAGPRTYELKDYKIQE